MATQVQLEPVQEQVGPEEDGAEHITPVAPPLAPPACPPEAVAPPEIPPEAVAPPEAVVPPLTVELE